MNINVCQLAEGDWQATHTLANYTHLIPIAITILLAIFVIVKSKGSLLSKIFIWFSLGFCLWLIGDVILWTNNNYYLITALWAPLDYINILFYLFAAYFFGVMSTDKDLPLWQKIIILALSLPGWWITFSGQSITGFNQPQCEAFNNDFLTNYKLWLEIGVLTYIFLYGLYRAIKSDWNKRKQIFVVGTALILFLSIFASTEYISSITGIYELNLYSLLVLPLFLALIIFSITNLKIFAYRSFGMQLLIYVLLILVGSQFFFLENATDRYLTITTLGLSAFLGILLARNIRREEQMAIALEEANAGQENLIHIMNHQIKGYLGKAKNIFAELGSEPEYCASEEAKPMLEEGLRTVTEGVDFVQQVLLGSSAEKGTLTYNMTPLDLKPLAQDAVEKQKGFAAEKHITLDFKAEEGSFNTNADAIQLKEAVRNLIDNSIRYTPSGNISVELSRKGNKALLTVRDTGMGITNEDMSKLFQKGGRGKDSLRYNVNSTGYGLAFVKGVVEAHKGRVWAESAGAGKGSVFHIELPLS